MDFSSRGFVKKESMMEKQTLHWRIKYHSKTGLYSTTLQPVQPSLTYQDHPKHF